MTATKSPRHYRPTAPPDPEAAFWRLAMDAASAGSMEPAKLYQALQRQYRSACPGADHLQHEAAMTRLAELCGV